MLICIYCGDVMGDLTKEQIKLFGKPRCCEYDMLKIDDFKLHTIVRAIEKLKSNLEKEILKNID
jgi:hypothetical protein